MKIFFVVVVVIVLFAPYDDTDPPGWFKRSGLSLMIDNRTGCHYIKGGYFGGTTPRLDHDGKHICEVKQL